MPYVDRDRREELDRGESPENAGELNYSITRTVDRYLVDRAPVRYADLNEVIGALESAKLELYRRVVVPYEEKKLETAGDVYNSLQ